jgi:tryptophan halogenase
MFKKRIAIIGRGTAGSQSVIHYLNHFPDYEIQWFFDSKIPTQAVGEGSTLSFPSNLYKNLNFNYSDLDKIDGTIKTGIHKSGWGNNQKDFFHGFDPPNVSLHFNAKALQNYILSSIKNKVKLFDKSVTEDEIDADYIIDCSGKPKSYQKFHESPFIPVNSAYITQCYWEYPRFQYTLTIARPYGWVFGIPLKTRCSIGYLFNRNINCVTEIKEDVAHVFQKYNLQPSENTNYLEFENYYRKENYNKRSCYNGNASFFLEPLEATSIEVMSDIQKNSTSYLKNEITLDQVNKTYDNLIKQIECLIMFHYFSGSKYESEFWNFAKDRGKKCIELSLKTDKELRKMILKSYQKNLRGEFIFNSEEDVYGVWGLRSLLENLTGLGIKKDLLLELSKTLDKNKVI